jgi:maltooligosyltrehalose trehalohydrolase
MGQDWAASSPCLFFSNHEGELGSKIIEGRKREFPEDQDGDGAGDPSNPEDNAAFARSKLNWDERMEPGHAEIAALYSECLALRKAKLGPALCDRTSWTVAGTEQFIAIRYRLASGERLLLATFQKATISAAELPDSLRAPEGSSWSVVLSSNAARFGGAERPGNRDWLLAGPGAVWLELQTGARDVL